MLNHYLTNTKSLYVIQKEEKEEKEICKIDASPQTAVIPEMKRNDSALLHCLHKRMCGSMHFKIILLL